MQSLELLADTNFATYTNPVDNESSDDTPGVIRQYLMDFGSKLNDDQKLAFAKFTGANLQGTIPKWFKGVYEPHGVYELKARILLDHLGYRFPEHELMHQNVYEFSKHVGFSLCSFEEAEKLLGVSRITMMRVLSGRSGTTKERVELIKLYIEENAHALAEAIQDLPEFPRADLQEEPPSSDLALPSTLIANAGLDKAQLKTIAIGLIRALGPVAKLLASDNFTPDDREEVRQALGKYGVFDLKNDLIKLCGERARMTINTEDK